MKLKTKLMIFTATSALTATMAAAAVDPNALAAEYQAAGYTSVEVSVGPTQTKIEAVKPGEKLEIIFDNVTNAELKREVEIPDEDDLDDIGVEIEFEDDDFLDDDEDDEDDEEDDLDDVDDDSDESDDGDEGDGEGGESGESDSDGESEGGDDNE